MKRALLLALTLLSLSCITELSPAPELTIDQIVLGENVASLPDSIASNMNGVYSVLEGDEIFGSEVVGRWIGDRWCLHANYDVVYGEFVGGGIRDSIVLAGYVRVVRSGTGSRLNFSALPSEGGSLLVSGMVPDDLILRGITDDGRPVILKRLRAMYNPSSKFFVIAHRGGGRNSERLGISENSIAMILHAEVLGADGVEIDIKRTRDNQLILFHDDTFSPRTVRGAYLLGRVGNFDLDQIQQYGRLVNGEPIPTLVEALNAVIDNTDLSLVWLDVKDAGSVEEVIRIQSEAMDRARKKNRDLTILFGIPSREILDTYNASPRAHTTPILIELDVGTALASPMCEVWAPRWTNGIPAADIDRVHAAGRRVFTWTLDVRDYISDFLHGSAIDGILTNYPSLVAGMEYSKE